MLEVGGLRLTPQRIFCVGRNYADHAKEMGGAPPMEPVIFMKPATSVVAEGEPLTLPRGRGSVHHEMELVAIIGRAGWDIAAAAALSHVAGATLGIDLTLRDLQAKLKQAGEPWELAKAFDGSAALGRLTPWPAKFDLQSLRMRCTVNGALRQQGHTGDMIFPLAAVISFLSRSWHLLPGDLIYTGTPAGVGPLNPGDRIEIGCPELGSFRWVCA
jgi:2-keto-4-pentenoate hydratase/2-oxohepta-3-ene-1,7-dioic acid hydratase in catechol pathway